MKQYTIIHPLYMSFYSKSLYREIAREWTTGFCFLYLLSLTALCWIPGMIRLDSDVTVYIENEAPRYIKQLPAIEISKGQASIREPQPYIIKDPDNGDPVIIIDTTGQITSLNNSKASILVTRDQIVTHGGGSQSSAIQLSEFGDMTIDQGLVYDWIDTFSSWFGILLYPFAVFISFAFRSVQVFVYALVARLFIRVPGGAFDYNMIKKLGAVSLTPVMISNSLINFFRIDLPFPWLLNALLAAGYLIFALRAAITPSES